MADQVPSFQERRIAGQTLLAASRRVNESLTSFSGWLMAGVGAAFSVIVANVQTVSGFVSLSQLRCALLLLSIGLLIGVIARYLAAIVAAGIGSHEDGEALGIKLGESAKSFDIDRFAIEFERGLFPPVAWIARRSIAKAKAGDIVAGARMIAKLSQLQAWLILLQALLAIIAACTLVVGLKAQ